MLACFQKPRVIIYIFFLTALLFSRFFNLQQTARFTQDESSDLARMHSYWQDKKITLVGPISNDNNKVFSSLTYYMQLPFAAFYNFEPVGPVVGTAFWGVITVLLLFFLGGCLAVTAAKKTGSLSIKDSPQLVFFWLLLLVWPPLLVSSRWAWNPHLISFWVALALVIQQFQFKGKHFLLGLFLGLTIHHHYLAVFAAGMYLLAEVFLLVREKKTTEIGFLVSGFVVALLPFVLFDLRHPPGLFFSRYLQSDTPHLVRFQVSVLGQNLFRNIQGVLQVMTHLGWLQLPVLVGLATVIWHDFKNNQDYLRFLLPVVAQVVGLIMIDDFAPRYFLPAVVFLLVWLVLPRKRLAQLTTTLIFSAMLLSALLQLPKNLTQPVMQPSMRVVTQAQHVIVDLLQNNPEIKNHNIAALTANDLDSLGLKYRDLLSVRGVTFKAPSEYDTTEHLLVVSDQDEEAVRQDPNVAMVYFREGRLRGEYFLEEKPWRVLWFSH